MEGSGGPFRGLDGTIVPSDCLGGHLNTITAATRNPGAIVNVFRDMAWLNTRRARAYAVVLAIVWIALIAGVFWAQQYGHATEGVPFGVDYSSYWAASRLILAGQPADVYIPAMHSLAELPVYTGGEYPFLYPPTYLALCIPLALLPFIPSLAVFLCVTGAALSDIIRQILRTPWSVVATVAFPPVAMNIMAGQNAFLTAAILGAGLAMLDRRPRLAGAVLGLMVIKPQLALAVPIALIISRRWAALLFAGITALCLLALSCLVFGWDTWVAFLANAHNQRYVLEHGLPGSGKFQSAFALARSLDIGVAYIVQASVAAACIYTLIWARRRQISVPMERSLIVLACLLMAPYLLFYDMVILVLPLAWMLREWMDRGFPPWSKLVLLLVYCVPGVALLSIPFGLPVTLVFAGFLLTTSSAPVLAQRSDRLTVSSR